MAFLNPQGDKDWGYTNYTFGQDSQGSYITGNTAYNTKKGIVDSGTKGKTYLDSDTSKWNAGVLSAYKESLSNDGQYQTPQTFSLMDTTAQDSKGLDFLNPQGNQDSLSNDSLYQAPRGAAPTDFSMFNDSGAPPGQQVDQNMQSGSDIDLANSGVPGVQIKSSINGGSTTTINPSHYSNQLNYLGYKMLSPQDLKRGLTSGQGLGTTQSAGNLSNKALVQRQSLLGR